MIAYQELGCVDCGDKIPKGAEYYEIGDGGEYTAPICVSCKMEMEPKPDAQ